MVEKKKTIEVGILSILLIQQLPFTVRNHKNRSMFISTKFCLNEIFYHYNEMYVPSSSEQPCLKRLVSSLDIQILETLPTSKLCI